MSELKQVEILAKELQIGDVLRGSKVVNVHKHREDQWREWSVAVLLEEGQPLLFEGDMILTVEREIKEGTK